MFQRTKCIPLVQKYHETLKKNCVVLRQIFLTTVPENYEEKLTLKFYSLVLSLQIIKFVLIYYYF